MRAVRALNRRYAPLGPHIVLGARFLMHGVNGCNTPATWTLARFQPAVPAMPVRCEPPAIAYDPVTGRWSYPL